MNIKCILGSHIWEGCKCTQCSKIRNEQHIWNGCKCSRCNTTRNKQHEWDGSQCSRCGRIPEEWDLQLESVKKLTDKSAILEIALKTIDYDVMRAAFDKLDQSIILEIVLKTEGAKEFNNIKNVSNPKEYLHMYNLYVAAFYKLNKDIQEKFDNFHLNELVSSKKGNKDWRDRELRSMASKYDSDAQVLDLLAKSETDQGREVTFDIPCGVCGYKTNVTVMIDWGGTILSGKGPVHEFRCQNCKKVFTVNKDSLKQYTDRFV